MLRSKIKGKEQHPIIATREAAAGNPPEHDSFPGKVCKLSDVSLDVEEFGLRRCGHFTENRFLILSPIVRFLLLRFLRFLLLRFLLPRLLRWSELVPYPLSREQN